MERMTWQQIVDYLREYNDKRGYKVGNTPTDICTVVVVITQDSFSKEYTEEERSYKFTNDNKAFISGMLGYSIFSQCIGDPNDRPRLEQYLEEEGNPGGWKVDYCYIMSED